MAKNRMAGDALSAKDEGFRNSNERRLGTEEYDRLSGEGLDDADEAGRYSAKEVIAEMRSGRDGKTTEEMADYYQGLADSGTKFNARAQKFLSDRHGVTFGGGDITTNPVEPEITQTDPVDPTPSVGEINIDTGGTVGDGGTGGINQDNDVVTTIVGSGNTVTNNQDNSIGGASSYAKELRDKYVLNLQQMTGV